MVLKEKMFGKIWSTLVICSLGEVIILYIRHLIVSVGRSTLADVHPRSYTQPVSYLLRTFSGVSPSSPLFEWAQVRIKQQIIQGIHRKRVGASACCTIPHLKAFFCWECVWPETLLLCSSYVKGKLERIPRHFTDFMSENGSMLTVSWQQHQLLKSLCLSHWLLWFCLDSCWCNHPHLNS